MVATPDCSEIDPARHRATTERGGGESTAKDSAALSAGPSTGEAPATGAPTSGVPVRSVLTGATPPGDAEFRALYEAHFKLVWGSLRRLGVRDADVMDLTQKVFITAYMKFPEFEGRSRVTTWLVAICQRLASDYRRSAAVRREVTTDVVELERHGAPLEDSASALAERRRAALAEAILNRLPEPQRTVFVLFELEELSGPEIAEILEISVGTVRSRLRLARETFAREVKRLAAVERASKETP
jgi:RNA polymerase sigma-70 factor (ECF subfamily)